jgi:hypothetical protein
LGVGDAGKEVEVVLTGGITGEPQFLERSEIVEGIKELALTKVSICPEGVEQRSYLLA